MTNNDRHVRENSRNPVGVAGGLARQPNVVPQSPDNVGLWDGATLGLVNVQTPELGRCPRSGSDGRGQSAESAFHFNPGQNARGIRSRALAATVGILGNSA